MAQNVEDLDSGSWFDDAHWHDVYAYNRSNYGLWTPDRTSGTEKYPPTGTKVNVTPTEEYYEDYVDIHLY